MRLSASCTVLSALLLAACGAISPGLPAPSDGGPASSRDGGAAISCVVGSISACACASGAAGVQACRNDGTFEACNGGDGGAACAVEIVAERDGGSAPVDGGVDGGPPCVLNQTRACLCSDEGAGAEACGADGRWGACARDGVNCRALEAGGIAFTVQPRFLPQGGPAVLDCSGAGVSQIRLRLFQPGDGGAELYAFRRPCARELLTWRVPLQEYGLRLEGLDDGGLRCYAVNLAWTPPPGSEAFEVDGFSSPVPGASCLQHP